MTEMREDYSSPTTSNFMSRMPQCRQIVSSLEETLDVDRESLTKMKKAVKAIYNSGNAHVDNELYLSQALERLGHIALSKDQEPDLGAALIKFSVVTKELSNLMKGLMHHLNNIILFPLDSLLKGDLRGVKGDLKRPFDKAMKDYETKYSKLEKEKKAQAKEAGLIRTEIMPAEVADEMEKERRLFQLHMCEYLIKVNEIKMKKGVELLQHLVEYYHAQSNYFQEGLKTMEHFGNYVAEMAGKLHRIRQQGDEERRQFLELRSLLRNSQALSSEKESGGMVVAQPSTGYSLHQLQGNKAHGTERIGYLFKKSDGKMRKVWQKRKCEVIEGYLCIRHSDESKPPSMVNLLTSQIKLIPDDRRCFDLVAYNRTYHFQGEDENDRDAWVSVLINSKERLLMHAFHSGGQQRPANDSVSASFVELQQQVVKQVMQLPGNDLCCDCSNTNDVTWLSTNFGVLICIECSGVHRDLGVHISRVQSLVLDNVGTAHLLVARAMSNVAFNDTMEATLRNGKPTPTSTMEERRTFIRAKYVDKKYVLRTTVDSRELLTDLEQAVVSRHLYMLLQAWGEGADISAPLPSRPNRETALHIAVEQEDGSSLHIVDFLVQNSPDLNVHTAVGDTSLHVAANRGQTECIKLLLRSGADPNVENAEGHTPLNIARDKGYDTCAELVQHALANKKSMFENVSCDWAISQDEASTDLSDEETMVDTTRPGSVTPAGSEVNVTQKGHVMSQRSTSRSSSVSVVEQGNSGGADILYPGSSIEGKKSINTGSLKKRAAPRPPPSSTSSTDRSYPLKTPPDPSLSPGSGVPGHRRSPSGAAIDASTGPGRGVPMAGARQVLPSVPVPGNYLQLRHTGRHVTDLLNGQGLPLADVEEKPPTLPLPRQTPDSRQRARKCRALYDCDADNEDELSFREGDIIFITNTETDDENWLEGQLERDPLQKGLFPVSFVHMLNLALQFAKMALIPTQQKLAEKLTILNDRGLGMLTRIYNIKKACGDPKFKPSFLSDKGLDSTVKTVVKRFPNIDIKGVGFHPLSIVLIQNNLSPIRADVLKSLALYYNTFVDLLDLRDHISELFTIMDACAVHLDIGLNYDMTKGYLDLMATYVSLMLLLARVEDRKAVLGLYNAAHEMTHNQGDPSFPRLGQMILDFEQPLKKLSEEFFTHSRLLLEAIASLHQVYPKRNLSSEQLRSQGLLSVLRDANQMLTPSRNEVVPNLPCEFLSVDVMDRWIICGYRSCQIGLVLCHQHILSPTFSELWTQALQGGWVISLFRDELWPVHLEILAFFESIKGYGKRVGEVKEAYNTALANSARVHRERRKFLRSILKEQALIFTDQPGLLGPKAMMVLTGLSLARDEVLWLIRHHENLPSARQAKNKTSLEDLVDRHLPELLFYMEELRQLVRKYSQVLQRYYIQYLSQYDAVTLNLEMQNVVCGEDESLLLTSLFNTISNLSVKQVEEGEVFDLRGLRMDWHRLQAYASSGKAPFTLREHPNLARLLTTIASHSRFIDALDQLLRHHIRERSVSVVNQFLDEMSKEAKNIITAICDEQCTLSDRLLPKHSATSIAQQVNKKKREKMRRIAAETNKPGLESYRKTREALTTMDKMHMALTELCFALNYCPTITVWDYTFAPREFLFTHLESRFARALVGMVMYNGETAEIAKPSELLSSVRAYMSILQTVENHVLIDITRVFNSVLLQQTQMLDSHGERTIASLYSTWYSEVLLRRVSAGHIVYSPAQKAFVSTSNEGAFPFNAEEFSDRNVLDNKEALLHLRTHFDKPEEMKEYSKKLTEVDSVMKRMTIIGVILGFRRLVQEALEDVLFDRIPFLMSSILDFRLDPTSQPDSLMGNIKLQRTTKVDFSFLVNAETSAGGGELDDYLVSCLLMVFVAVSIPRLARWETSMYRPQLEAHGNNVHCLALAVNEVFPALFTLHGHGDIEDRLKEFLALASSSLLRLGQDPEKESAKHRESIYLLLDLVVKESSFLSMDLLESCFPYPLIRTAYNAVYRQHGPNSLLPIPS
ncbi:unnamed protein product [Darwinula stevensoni]|uniref:Uncharacterized protein n=1 Tax=Darwinula stevensoni TaxID=69355 RepID=A0A7R8XCE8_9CRUS|nr:unnamed protein product [Darwinula stevensoni]CAG0885765.1 unnamed protein product [Darwinula stevensoni]